MIKKVKWGLIGLVVLLVAFTFTPTSMSAKELMKVQSHMTVGTVYNTSQTHGVAGIYQDIREKPELAEAYASTMREAICKVATDIAWNWGNGIGDHAATKIFYCGVKSSKRAYTSYCHYPGCGTTSVGGTYGTYAMMKEVYDGVQNGDVTHMHGSCAAFATFCQRVVWEDAPWTRGSTSLAVTIMGGQFEGDGSSAYIKEHGKPGDLIVQGNGSTSFQHTILYIGPWTAPDGSVSYEHAVCEMSWDSGNQDCHISDIGNRSNLYLIPLDKEILYLAQGKINLTAEYSNVEPDAIDEVDPDSNTGGTNP